MNEYEELEMLLLEARAGDNAAKESLLAILRARARRYAASLLGRESRARADASDIAQDAFLGCGFDPTKFQSVREMLGWLNKVVRNARLDLRRHNSALSRDEGRDVAGGDIFCGLAAETPSPEDQADQAEQASIWAARLGRAILQLTEKEQAVLLLKLREDLTDKEIARQMAISEVNARVLLSHARKKLRKLLVEED